MDNSEKQFGLIQNVSCSPDIYDFYITSKRLIAINTASKSNLFLSLGLVGEVFDFAIERNQDKKRSELTKNLSVEEILDKDKRSFEIPYSNVEWIWLHPKSGFKSPKMSIKLTGIHLHRSKWDLKHEMQKNQEGKFMEYYEICPDFSLTIDQFEKLSTTLPQIVGLNGKLAIK